MKLPIPVFFTATVIFTAVLAVKRAKHTRLQNEANESFLERERLANATRRKDISGLDYLPFSADALPLSNVSDPELLQHETVLKELSGKKIINLSMYSNTDLKLMYGPANLNELTECDDNYHLLASTLLSYANRKISLGYANDAVSILEYAMSLKIDSSKIYLLLAELYQKQNTPEKIERIADCVASMDKSFSSFLAPKLDAFRTAK